MSKNCSGNFDAQESVFFLGPLIIRIVQFNIRSSFSYNEPQSVARWPSPGTSVFLPSLKFIFVTIDLEYAY